MKEQGQLKADHRIWVAMGTPVPPVPPPHVLYPLYQHPSEQQVGPALHQPQPLPPVLLGQHVPSIQLRPGGPLPQHVHHIPWPPHQGPSQHQPHPPVPHDQHLPYRHPLPQGIPPQGRVHGADRVAIPQTVRNAWEDLDAVIHTARRMKATVGLREDALVPDAVTHGLKLAVASVTQTAEVLKRWMQGPTLPPQPPQPHVQLPPGIDMSLQARSYPQETCTKGSH